MGREPFEAPGPPPIGRARPYQTPPGGPWRRGAINGLPRRLFVNPEPDPTRPGPAPTPPPSPKCLHLHQSVWAGPEGREEVGDGMGADCPARELAPARILPRGCSAAREAPPLSRARDPLPSPRASRTPQVCQSHRGSRARWSPRPPRAAGLRACAGPGPSRAGLRASPKAQLPPGPGPA